MYPHKTLLPPLFRIVQSHTDDMDDNTNDNTDERRIITPDDGMTDKWIYERICMDEINNANAHTQFEFYLTQQAQFDD